MIHTENMKIGELFRIVDNVYLIINIITHNLDRQYEVSYASLSNEARLGYYSETFLKECIEVYDEKFKYYQILKDNVI